MSLLSHACGNHGQCLGHSCFGASGPPARWEQGHAVDGAKSLPHECEVPLSSMIRTDFRTTRTRTTPASHHTVGSRISLGSRESPRDSLRVRIDRNVIDGGAGQFDLPREEEGPEDD
eukprot:6465102-Amphidinium_carterae.1